MIIRTDLIHLSTGTFIFKYRLITKVLSCLTSYCCLLTADYYRPFPVPHAIVKRRVDNIFEKNISIFRFLNEIMKTTLEFSGHPLGSDLLHASPFETMNQMNQQLISWFAKYFFIR